MTTPNAPYHPTMAPSSGPAASVLESAEIRAWTDMFDALPAPLAQGLGAEPLRDGPAWRVRTARVPGPMFNRAIGYGLAADPASGAGLTDAHLDAVLDWLGPAGRFQAVPGLGLEPRLAARGLQRTTRWHKLWWGVEVLPTAPSPLAVVPVDDVAKWSAAVALSHGMPPVMGAWLATLPGRPGWTCVQLVAGREIVGGGALHVSDGVGWLGMGGTLPEHRQCGGQTLVIAARIAAAAAQGARWVITETGEATPTTPAPSARNLLRCGFASAYLRENWARTP